MIEAIIRYLRGYLKVEITGYSPERFLNLCRYHHIYIWGLAPKKNAYKFYISLRGFYKLKPIVKKTHTKIHVSGKYGVPFFTHRYRKRKLFFLGLILCTTLLYFYSGFIWDIHFEGNEKWTDEVLSEFLASKDVQAFMKKSEVNCPEIAKEIREEYNDIVWVSASIDGSCLKIKMKENEDSFLEEESETGKKTPKDLVATQDGVITKIITRSGVPQVHIGDTVSKGEILVSGRVDVVDDSGEVIDYQYQVSDADIFADTQLEYTDSMPLSYSDKIYDKKHRSQYYLQLGQWKFSVGTIKNKYENPEISTEEHRVKLGENFYLPIWYGQKTVQSYHFKEKKYTKKEIQEQLSANFHQFCKELEEKGIQIKRNSVKIHIGNDKATASGILYLNQQITQEADTEILIIERNEQDESVRTGDGYTG